MVLFALFTTMLYSCNNMHPINTYAPLKILTILANIFEISREEKNLSKLEEGLKLSEVVDTNRFNKSELCRFHYFVANGWSYVLLLKYDSPEKAGLSSMEYEKEIYHLRVALNFIDDTDEINACQILTNLGCAFSHIGRYVEAQYYFNWALKINPDFGMALGNKGYGLYRYAREIFDASHQFIFLQYARKYLLEALGKKDVYPDVENGFCELANYIANSCPSASWDDYKVYPDILKDCSDEDMDYRLWCIDNVLFLNPLNDVIQQNIVARDILHTPTMTLKSGDKPIYQSIFNQIKQEFVSARFFFYDGAYHDGAHFSDREVTLYRVFDQPLYSINIEKVKIAFRLCYSIFDKIAYLLNIYLNLGIDKNRVNFRNIWHESGDGKKPIRTDIFNTHKLALQGLFWLSKDLYEKNSSPIEPEAKEIATIRNYIEHKSFKVVEAKNPCWDEAPETYEIEQDAFYDKAMRLLRLTRSALIYLSSAIYEEERYKTPLNGGINTIEMELL